MIYLYGASGHGKVITEILRSQGEDVCGIFDDDQRKKIWELETFSFPGPFNSSSDKLIITIGDNGIRRRISRSVKGPFHIAVHSTAIVSSTSRTGTGTVIMAGAIVNADAFIGDHCIINTAAVIEHDCIVHDYVHISPNATLCGGVIVGEGTHVGAGSVIIQGKKIGSNSIIGAGSVVINDIPANVVAVGNPARVIKSTIKNGKDLSLATAYGRK
jgi:sugar O-acyltransferase (sialic acid O-acetyltransferase NeuD family)